MTTEAISTLLGTPVDLETARERLPQRNGVYARWTLAGAIPGVPERLHPVESNLALFYVGIAPVRASSSATLNSRVVGNHLKGNTGSSTFRLTLASLLIDELGFRPRQTKTKFVLPPDQNRRLSDWQQSNLRLTWSEHDKPWNIEDAVIAELEPPLNLAKNASHPFHSTLTKARERFRGAARNAAPQS